MVQMVVAPLVGMAKMVVFPLVVGMAKMVVFPLVVVQSVVEARNEYNDELLILLDDVEVGMVEIVPSILVRIEVVPYMVGALHTYSSFS